jgi:hypothetical protein
VAVSGCSDAPLTAPTEATGGGTTITISGSSISPRNLTVARGARVTFRNEDGRTYDIRSDAHPNHSDCLEINQIGSLSPGNIGQTAEFAAPKRCGFHDEDHYFSGSIEVQ